VASVSSGEAPRATLFAYTTLFRSGAAGRTGTSDILLQASGALRAIPDLRRRGAPGRRTARPGGRYHAAQAAGCGMGRGSGAPAPAAQAGARAARGPARDGGGPPVPPPPSVPRARRPAPTPDDTGDVLGSSSAALQPLAERMRPRSLDEMVGQRRLLARGSALRRSVEAGAVHSMILWGPPGCGKTTLALL